MRKWALLIVAALILSACAGQEAWAPDEAVTKAAYRNNGPARLTLFTMINNKTGAGAHSSLMINGSQRVIFDPAGSFRHESIPVRNDVLFGITPKVEDAYTRYHARQTYRVQVQQVDVSPEVAEMAMREVMANGAVGKARCSYTTSRIIARLPGFEQVRQTWFPRKLAEQFGKIPGVTSRELYEYDSDDNSKVLAAWNPGT
jgi:hypothetical protein